MTTNQCCLRFSVCMLHRLQRQRLLFTYLLTPKPYALTGWHPDVQPPRSNVPNTGASAIGIPTWAEARWPAGASHEPAIYTGEPDGAQGRVHRLTRRAAILKAVMFNNAMSVMSP